MGHNGTKTIVSQVKRKCLDTNRTANHIVSILKYEVFKNETSRYERNPAGVERKSGGALVADGWAGARFEARRDLCRRHKGRHQDDPARPAKARPLGMAQGEARAGRGSMSAAPCVWTEALKLAREGIAVFPC